MRDHVDIAVYAALVTGVALGCAVPYVFGLVSMVLRHCGAM